MEVLLLVLIGVVMAFSIRKIQRPERFAGSHLREADFILLAIVGIVLTLFVINATRISLGVAEAPPAWTPVSEALSRTIDSFAPGTLRLLEEMFLMRHELLSIRTTAAESRDVFARMGALTRMIPPEAPPLIDDLIDRFERVKSLCDNEKEFTQGIIDFYQARTTTRMNVAMERLALIAAVLLPVTAIASIYGMNLIVEERSDLPQLGIVLAVMVLVTGAMLTWSKRLGWW